MSDSEDLATPSRPAVLEREGAFADRDAWTAAGWCRLETALEVVGTRSAMVLVREVFYGANRFDELVRRTGLSEAVASGRLKDLVAHGLLERRPYREPGARTRDEYVLTDLGSRLFPVVVGLMAWGEDLRDDHRSGVQLVHRDCGAPLEATVRCTAGHEVALDHGAVRIKDEEWAGGARRPT